MNNALLKHKPKDATAAEFMKAFANAQYVLTPIYALLDELITSNNRIKKDDFTCPNHYAQLAYQAGENNAYAFVRSLLADVCKE